MIFLGWFNGKRERDENKDENMREKERERDGEKWKTKEIRGLKKEIEQASGQKIPLYQI